jgi:hypothetical protein
MAVYHWDLIERLLHEAQNSAGKPFAPRHYAEELADELGQAGERIENLDHFRAEATRYESLLVENGFIVTRPEHPREVLDGAGDAALTPEVFDDLAPKANLESEQT